MNYLHGKRLLFALGEHVVTKSLLSSSALVSSLVLWISSLERSRTSDTYWSKCGTEHSLSVKVYVREITESLISKFKEKKYYHERVIKVNKFKVQNMFTQVVCCVP